MIIPPMDESRIRALEASAPTMRFLVAEDVRRAIDLAPGAEAVLSYSDPRIWEAASGLRWVQAPSAGVESYPFELFRRRGVVLTNAKRIYGVQLADHALALILALSRQLPFLFRAQDREVWVSRDSYPPGELDGETLLVVGLGGTGLEVARRAKSFGMRVVATRLRPGNPVPPFVDELHPADALGGLLGKADWVVICVPLVPGTRDLIGESQLRGMKRSARIVCVTRGGIINTDALVRALREEWIAGAGLDVTDPEPLPAGHPLWKMDNAIITPHAAGHSPKAGERMFALLKENVARFCAGRELENVVDLELGD